MALVSQSIPNLKGGVSQQPDILRFPDQGQLQDNMFSSEIEGLQKRPPTVHVKRLADKQFFGEKPYIHTINRDEKEQYIVLFDGKSINIFDVEGNFKTITYEGSSKDYITVNHPREDLRMVTVADFTFIVNRQQVTTKSDTKTEGEVVQQKCNITVKGGQFERTYRIKENDRVIAEYKTEGAYVKPDAPETKQNRNYLIDTSYIMEKLAASFKGTGTMTYDKGDGFIVWNKGSDIGNVTCEDGYNGQLMVAVVANVQKVTDLPRKSWDGHYVMIEGDASETGDQYWVRYIGDEQIWRESAKPQIDFDFLNETLPHALISNADGTFTFKTMDWEGRASGDDDTNPFPSFVDGCVNDVFFYRNRLGFLSGENVILSASGNYFNFFPKSVAVAGDSDPIDVAVSTNRVAVLKYAVPFSEELLLWSDEAQFVLSSDGSLSITNIKLDLTTQFDVSDNARPTGVGRNVYFASPRAQFSSIRRYYAVQDTSSVKNADDISAHVPSYIPNGIFDIYGSTTENFCTVLTEGSPNQIFVYKFLYMNEQLQQQSWSTWSYQEGATVLMFRKIGKSYFVVLDTPSGIFLERMDFTYHTKDYPTEPFRLFMNRKIEYLIPADAYDDDLFETTIKLKDIYGAAPKEGKYWISVQTLYPDEPFVNNKMIEVENPTGGWDDDGTIKLYGNYSNHAIVIGEAYMSRYIFSKLLIKQTEEGRATTEDTGRLQLRRMWVNYNKSGNFVCHVDHHGRRFSYSMTGMRISDVDSLIGEAALDSGQLKFPIGGNAQNSTVTIESDTPNPIAIIGGGWNGDFVKRATSI